MAVIQISKIQLRRGVENELLANSLDPGEVAFTVDSGRLFIGPDPNYSGPWTGRSLMPYNNIEILTETAMATFARMFDSLNRTLGPVGLVEGATTYQRNPYLIADIGVTASWTPVMVDRVNAATGTFNDQTTEEMTLVESNSGGGIVEYFLLSANSVVRTGVLTMIHDGNPTNDEAQLVDENMSVPAVIGNGTPVLVDELFVTGVQFRAMRVSSGVNTYRIRLEYINTTANTYTVQFRAMVTSVVTP